MEWFRAIGEIVRQWWIYLDFCVEADIQAPVCRAFWTWVSMACAAMALSVLAAIVWKIVSYRFKLAAALRAKQERQRMADDETMRQHVWEGDKAYQSNARTEDLELRIQAGLSKLKQQGGGRSENNDPPLV